MHSERLKQLGLLNQLGHKPHNFKDSQGLDCVAQEFINLARQVSPSNIGIVYANQVHQAHVADLDDLDLTFNQVYRLEAADGLMTNRPGLALNIKFADCTPVVIYDPIHQAQAIVHSGWRSTQTKISQVAINQMVDKYQSKPEDLVIYVGPTIDQTNYEVGPEVYRAFEDFSYRDDFFVKSSRPGKYLMSMQEANLGILLEAGIQINQIELANHSTFTDPKLHSARRQGPSYGLNAMVTMIPLS